ncbi:MAG TPA: hypothetical protein VFC19_02975 [Candidatus Limnocylindrales bacterium]|nr:hypothetical protein [Candidatus Limnocylindrales bacterium]
MIDVPRAPSARFASATDGAASTLLGKQSGELLIRQRELVAAAARVDCGDSHRIRALTFAMTPGGRSPLFEG